MVWLFLDAALLLLLVQELDFQLIVSHFEVRDQPVDDVLECDVSNNGFKRFAP